MAFKLKSGNQPKFKMVGSSPVKATATEMAVGEGLNTPTAIKIRENMRIAAEQKLENAKAKQKENKELVEYYGDESEPMREKNREKVEIDGKMVAPTEGTDIHVKDEDISKYKSKTQIKHDAKMRKLRAKEEDGYSDEEKYANRQAKLQDKITRAKGTGGSSLTFDWKSMLLGDSIAAGFKIKPKKDVLAKRKAKHTKGRDTKLAKEESKSIIKAKKYWNKEYKDYVKLQNKNNSSAKSFAEWKESRGKKRANF